MRLTAFLMAAMSYLENKDLYSHDHPLYNRDYAYINSDNEASFFFPDNGKKQSKGLVQFSFAE